MSELKFIAWKDIGRKEERERILKVIDEILDYEIPVIDNKFDAGYKSALLRLEGIIKNV